MSKTTYNPCIPRVRQHRLSGFTMVELLIVVAIITMLASLLLAALSSAKEAGRRAKCASNMRQLATLAIIYSHDNSGFAPSIVDSSDAASGVGVVAPVSVNPLAGGGNSGGGNSGGGNSGGGNSGGGNSGGGSTGGGSTGGGGTYPNCTPDANNMVWICHIPPGNPAGLTTEYVGWTATGPQGHQNHGTDHCGPCGPYIGANWNNFLDNLYNGYLASMLGSGTGFSMMSCPTDINPEFVLLVDQNGNAHHFPCSYNENLELALTRSRLERLSKPSATVLFYDGRPSNLVGEYNIANYNTKYATFRHLNRVNIAYVDGHVESQPVMLQSEIQVY
jgi:prepilin-type processing-associated H-X9-DG protein/prepilin-type N-terminal cleavage/methylation domain-containing protein